MMLNYVFAVSIDIYIFSTLMILPSPIPVPSYSTPSIRSNHPPYSHSTNTTYGFMDMVRCISLQLNRQTGPMSPAVIHNATYIHYTCAFETTSGALLTDKYHKPQHSVERCVAFQIQLFFSHGICVSMFFFENKMTQKKEKKLCDKNYELPF